MFVKPAPGLKVRDPDSKMHIPEEGKEVPVSSYWVRRLVDGDVIEVVQIPDSQESEEVAP